MEFWMIPSCGFEIAGAEFWIQPMRTPEMDFSQWIPDSFFSRIPDSKSFILHSSAQYSEFQGQKFPGFHNPDYIPWVDK